MTTWEVVLGILAAALGAVAAGFAVGWARAREMASGATRRASDAERAADEARAASEGQIRGLEGRLEEMRSELEGATAELREISSERAALRERIASGEELRRQLERDRAQMSDTFKALAGEALKHSSEELLKVAGERFGAERQKHQAELAQRSQSFEQLVKPIGEAIKRVDEKMVTINAQVEQSRQTSEGLRTETARLARALSRPEVRGRYGEIQLKRVAELAGMTGYCDFAEQTSVRDSEGNLKRPDMVVLLPAGRVVAVDAKCNIEPYVRAAEATDDEARERELERFASGIDAQMRALAGKKYWSEYAGSPDFVVMFVPGDQFVDAALSRKPGLLERAAEHGVILASPSTLIGLLRAVAVGWREHRLAEEAQQLLTLGRELHERAGRVFELVGQLGGDLERATKRYNTLVGSVESRLQPTLRKFEDSGVRGAGPIPEVKQIDVMPRLIVAEESDAADRPDGAG